jgi:hypothetical protein
MATFYDDPNNPRRPSYSNQGIEIFGGLDPQYEAVQQRRDPYGAGVQWDVNGNPIGQRLPRLENAIDWQYIANQKASQRRNALWGDAQGSLTQGLDLLQSFRPGGSAALASGMFGQRAQLYAGQAMDTEAPDLLMGFRQQKQLEADKEAKRANRISQILGGIQTAANVAGAVAGTGGGQPAQTPTGPSTTPPSSGVPGGQMPAGNVMGQPGSAGQFYGMGQATSQSQMAPSTPGGTRGQAAPMQPGGGGGAGGGAQSGTGQAQAGGGMMGPGAGGMKGDVPMSSFMPQEAAANAMMSTPGVGPIVYEEWAYSPERMSSTAMFVRTARSRLMAAGAA